MEFDWRIACVALTKEAATLCAQHKAHPIAMEKNWEPRTIQHDVSEDYMRLDVCEDNFDGADVGARVYAWKVKIWP